MQWWSNPLQQLSHSLQCLVNSGITICGIGVCVCVCRVPPVAFWTHCLTLLTSPPSSIFAYRSSWNLLRQHTYDEFCTVYMYIHACTYVVISGVQLLYSPYRCSAFYLSTLYVIPRAYKPLVILRHTTCEKRLTQSTKDLHLQVSQG